VRPGVLRLARDAVLLRHLFRALAHGEAGRVLGDGGRHRQEILGVHVGEGLDLLHQRAAARGRDHRLRHGARVGDGHVAHRFGSPHHRQIDLAQRDGIGGAGHRLQAGGAGPHHRVGVDALGQARGEADLARDVGHRDLRDHGAEDDLIDGGGRDFRPLHQLGDDLPAQLQRGEVLEDGARLDEGSAQAGDDGDTASGTRSHDDLLGEGADIATLDY